TVAIKEVLSNKRKVRSTRIMKSTDFEMLKCLGKWLVYYGEMDAFCVDSYLGMYTLYDKKHTLKLIITKLLKKEKGKV
ncbi:unnamed protein product, partial [marine sediment metagenome]